MAILAAMASLSPVWMAARAALRAFLTRLLMERLRAVRAIVWRLRFLADLLLAIALESRELKKGAETKRGMPGVKCRLRLKSTRLFVTGDRAGGRASGRLGRAVLLERGNRRGRWHINILRLPT